MDRVNANWRLAVAIATLALAACAPEGGHAASASTSCRLPVVISSFDHVSGTWSPAETGFLSYPGGTFTPANASGVRYDAKRKRWFPRGIPTPDGSSYVFADDANAIHLVAIDSGRDQVILSGAWVPIGFIGGQLYVAEAVPLRPEFASDGYTEGRLARVGASGGTPEFVTQHVGTWWISSRGGWSLDRADGLMQAPDRVLHLDLETGAVEPWLTGVPGVMLAGFDGQGQPFVFTTGDAVRVVQIIAKDQAVEVWLGPRGAPWPGSPYYVDGRKVWFSGFSTVDPKFEAPALLYEPGVGLHPSVGVPGAQVTVAGPCTNE